MKLLLTVLAMGCALAGLAVVAVLDLILSYWPLVCVLVAVWLGARWWLRHRGEVDRDHAGHLCNSMAPQASIVHPVGNDIPLSAAAGELYLVRGDESGLRPPPTWPVRQPVSGGLSLGGEVRR
ncbi:Uncharacterised protein [Mycobacteroides abscessus subsp. massiliense]|uniref:hypothetical protein n=1 Tax=Mycobacteroides abscessus TaxID=36809 RepID=UPI0009A8D26E|nr:hypothetical protein [Mycobacteroides abscessus]SKK91655.1 Uncharacterised protein [Mycobacteroides abscessus subsp. massiliense]